MITADGRPEPSEKPLGLDVSKASNGCVSTGRRSSATTCSATCSRTRPWARPSRSAAQLLYGGGLTIQTTVDLRFQRAADDAADDLTSTRPTRRSAPWRWSSPAPATSGRWPSRGRWAEEEGRDIPQLRRAEEVRRLQRLPGRLDVQGRSCWPRPSSRGSRSTDHQLSRPDAASRRRFADCDGNYQSSEPWTPHNSTAQRHLSNMYTGTQQSVNTFFAQLERMTGLCEP